MVASMIYEYFESVSVPLYLAYEDLIWKPLSSLMLYNFPDVQF